MNEVYVADFLRLPIGKQNGLYKNSTPEKFSAHLLQVLINRNPLLSNFTDSLTLSTAVGTGGNMARNIGLLAGLSQQMAAYTIDAQCVGSYQAIISGINSIKSGEADTIIVGGFESNSLRPKRFYHENDERNTNEPYFYADFAPPAFGNVNLAQAAESLTLEHGFTKEDLVDWAILSNGRATKAVQRGSLTSLICDFQGNLADENLKSTELLKRFNRNSKLIDASTSCMLDDGAGVIVLASQRGVNQLEVTPDFKIISSLIIGGDPRLAPEVFLDAANLCCQRIGKNVSDVDLFEINESFAIKPLLFKKRFKVSEDRINLLGGNLAYGHPFGASGAINLMHLLQSLKISNKNFGIVTASAAGGLGSALMVQQL
jgi:acetyl-CoA C-acetyltransferase